MTFELKGALKVLGISKFNPETDIEGNIEKYSELYRSACQGLSGSKYLSPEDALTKATYYQKILMSWQRLAEEKSLYHRCDICHKMTKKSHNHCDLCDSLMEEVIFEISGSKSSIKELMLLCENCGYKKNLSATSWRPVSKQ